MRKLELFSLLVGTVRRYTWWEH